MKFGKRLLDQAVPEWAASYLAYKNLKGPAASLKMVLAGLTPPFS